MIDITDYMNLKIIKHRWYIEIVVQQPDSPTQTWIASADNGDTGGDGIWFGTKEEREEDY